ncbi:hypothetical protein [Actinosynnema sp. NPDC020468]|uniref:hypothetical protein n=1 Tax=Actinosynnema sp. NPDC020468 TaxID=3154488 RepID=UPI0033D6B17B
MPRALSISLAGVGLVLLLCCIGWVYLRRRKKTETGVALAAVALLVSATLPLLAKPVEDAWTPLTAPSGQAPSSAVDPSPVPAPDVAKPVLRAGWGPDREMFTLERPAPFVTLDSITDNPGFGDEREFLGVRHVDATCGGATGLWQRHEKITAGDHLVFRVYAENSAADNLDEDGSHTVHGLRARVLLPDVVGDPTTGSAGQAGVSAILETADATPPEYWYTVLLSADGPVRLRLVPGSVRLENNHFAGGLAMGDGLFGEQGQLLGHDRLDGELRAGYQYDLYVSFCVAVTAEPA